MDSKKIKECAEYDLAFLQSLDFPSCEMKVLQKEAKKIIKQCSGNDHFSKRESEFLSDKMPRLEDINEMSETNEEGEMSETNLRELDIKTVMLHAGCTREQAIKALIDTKGYFIGAVLEAFKYKDESSASNEQMDK